MIVVADTSPINYLVLIDQVDLLRRLYGNVLIPPALLNELNDPLAPESIRLWLAQGVEWLQVRAPQRIPDDVPALLDRENERPSPSLRKVIVLFC
jgi:predicted nucleic acid-binding protein